MNLRVFYLTRRGLSDGYDSKADGTCFFMLSAVRYWNNENVQ